MLVEVTLTKLLVICLLITIILMWYTDSYYNNFKDKCTIIYHQFKINALKVMMKEYNIKDSSEVMISLIEKMIMWKGQSEKENNPIIKLSYSNYANAYLWALRTINTDENIKLLTGVDINNISKELHELNDLALLYTLKECPNSTIEQDKIRAHFDATIPSSIHSD